MFFWCGLKSDQNGIEIRNPHPLVFLLFLLKSDQNGIEIYTYSDYWRETE